MSELTFTRRTVVAGTVAAGAAGLLPGTVAVAAQPAAVPAASAGSNAIRPFRYSAPQAELVDLRRRINATRWPERETVTDQSQGVQLARIRPLVEYWGT